jgi:hypothetical protein
MWHFQAYAANPPLPSAGVISIDPCSANGLKDAQISQIDADMFERACEAIGLDDFHFHDLRHTWASWHVQAGTPLMVLKELGGWERIEMVQKYAHLAPTHLAAHATTVTFWSQQLPEKKIAA